MASVSEHYVRLLGSIYDWTLGGADVAGENARRDIAALQLVDTRGTAVDLGAGPGFHSVALAELGYTVVAVDSSTALLGELAERAGALPVRPVESDLAAFRRYVPDPCDVILCMGDTLTHLASRGAVATLVNDVAEALASRGIFCATFRDYTVALEGDVRFIPVRSDDARNLTCFLEYGTDTVMVHDLLHERGPDGWTFKVGSYPKLRLHPDWVAGLFEDRGCRVACDTTPAGMVRLVARAG